ncbi:MAG TPA: preprotein translocase subunit YajC [Nocardioidaceae bacterium]|nr:preprotein translocase subunit YajC [Nocardioidaceae bacterium]
MELLFPVLLVAAFWLLLIRPQQRARREALATQSAVVVGAEVMLTSGIYGKVTDLEDDWVHIEVSAGTVVKVARGAIARVFDDESDADTEPAATSEPTSENDDQ